MTTSLHDSLATAVTQLAAHPATTPLAARLRDLQARLDAGRFHLAVLGQFKRGKSTLLNALLGEPFLPTAIVPLTSIPTLIEHGPDREVRVVFQDGRRETAVPEALAQYVTETGNPGNRLGVARVEVRHPAALLARGVVLIDTPGIGSTLTYTTETTLDFLAEVDAALFLVSADPPLTAVELDFLQMVRRRVTRLFFLLNKVDYLSPTEQDEALRFLETTLREQAGLDRTAPVFPVSARLALKARQQGDAAAWKASGLAAVEDKVRHFLDNEKQATLQSAITSKTADVLHEALQLLQTERQALTMPLDTLQQKRQAFQQALVVARRQRQRAADSLAGDQARIVAAINERAQVLRDEALAHLHRVALAALDEAASLAAGEEVAYQHLAGAAEAFFAERQSDFSTAVYQEIIAVLAVHAGEANSLVEQIRRLAADLFEFEFTALSPDELPARPREPYWVTSTWTGGSDLGIASGTWERLLPAGRRRQRVLDRLAQVVEKLATQNVENLRWAVAQNSDQTLRQFKTRLDERWAETIEVMATVLDTAVTRRQQHADDVAPALDQLNQTTQLAAETLQVIVARLTPGCSTNLSA
jgi:hypothetical protein